MPKSSHSVELRQVTQRAMDKAAEVLASLLRQQVRIEVTDSWRFDCHIDIQRNVAAQLGVYMPVNGAVKGGLLLALSEDCAVWMSQQLLRTSDIADLLKEPACSTLKEVGNIIASAFLASFDDQLGLRALPGPPRLMFAPIAALLDSCRSDGVESCLVVQTDLISAADIPLQGAIYLFPGLETLQYLRTQLGQLD